MTLAEFIAQKLREAIAGALADAQPELEAIAKAGGHEASGGLLGDVGRITDIISNLIDPVLIAEIIVAPELAIPKIIGDGGGKLGTGFGFGYLLGYSLYQAAEPAFEPLNHAVANLLQTGIFDPATAAQLEAKGIIDNAYGRSEAAGGNLSGEHYDKMVDAARVRPELTQLLEMWNRELINETNVDTALQHHGIPQDWWPALKDLRRPLLSPADLALAFLRSDIDQTTLDGYRAQTGLSPADMDVIIGNTGEPPGPEQLMEALRRGFIDDERFARGIKQSRVRNEWLDVEHKLAFSPMTTADAVRAVVEGYFTSDEGKAIALQNGLEPEHWDTLVASWGRPLSHEQMMQLYFRGQATHDEVVQAFRESDLKNKYIEQAIELGRRLVPERTIVSMLDHGVIDHPRAVQMLSELGFNAEDANSLIALGVAQRTSSHKTLTKADILSMYTDSMLSLTAARDHLMQLGYSQADADAMLALADYKAKARTLKTLETGLEASYKAHHITADEVKTELVKAGLDQTQAAHLIDQWSLVRSTPTRSLTQAQILKAGELNILSVEDVRTRLIAEGLISGDVDILLRLHGIGQTP